MANSIQRCHAIPAALRRPHPSAIRVLHTNRPTYLTRCHKTEDAKLASIKAFDSDGDGKLTLAEVQLLLLKLSDGTGNGASQQAKEDLKQSVVRPEGKKKKPPATWDMHFVSGIQEAAKGEGFVEALARFLHTKLSNLHGNRVILSDVLWSFLGSFTAMYLLGLAAKQIKTWPFVGAWHQQGLPLLIGSFGTLSVLLFARPESEPVKVWNMIAGHVFSFIAIMASLQLCGPTVLGRAAAISLAIAIMLWTDCVFPPGGALVLLAVDNHVVQGMGLWFLLYPSVAFCAAIMLPLGLLVNWLKRNARFDFPGAQKEDNVAGDGGKGYGGGPALAA